MTTELRDYGDKMMVVLHTQNERIYRKLSKSTLLVKEVPYMQNQKGKVKMVGVDLYFPRTWRRWVRQQVKKIDPSEVLTIAD